jgi:hypothetical protein
MRGPQPASVPTDGRFQTNAQIAPERNNKLDATLYAGQGTEGVNGITSRVFKLVPKVYGDKTEVAVTGANGGPMQTVNATVEIPANDPIEAARVYQKLMSGD